MAAHSLKFLAVYIAASFCLFTESYGTLLANRNCDELWAGIYNLTYPFLSFPFAIYNFATIDGNGLLQYGVVSPAGNSDQLNNSSETVRITLLHREHPCAPAASAAVGNSSPSALSKYHARARRLTGHLSSVPADEVNISGPIIANGVPWDFFSYVTQIQLGTPAKTHSVLVDTGSSLPWVTCKPCRYGF